MENYPNGTKDYVSKSKERGPAHGSTTRKVCSFESNQLEIATVHGWGGCFWAGDCLCSDQPSPGRLTGISFTAALSQIPQSGDILTARSKFGPAP